MAHVAHHSKARVFPYVSFRRTFPFPKTEVILESLRYTCSSPSSTIVWEVKESFFAQMCLVELDSTTHFLTLVTRCILEMTLIIISSPLTIFARGGLLFLTLFSLKMGLKAL